jgi:site-specific recombinase XerD
MPKKVLINKSELDGIKKQLKDISQILLNITNNNIITNNNKKTDKISDEKPKKIKKLNRQCIEEEQFNIIINEIKKIEEESKRDSLLLLNCILFYSGLRVSEALLLNKDNIIELFEKESFNCYCSKTNDMRKIYLYKETQTKILNILNTNYEDFIKNLHENVFIMTFNNSKLTYHTAFYWMQPIFKILGLKYGDKILNDPDIKLSQWSFHSYRTNYINQAIRSGININDVSSMVGHNNICTTLKYSRIKNPTKDETYKNLKKMGLL